MKPRNPIKTRRAQVGAKERIAFRCTAMEKAAIEREAKLRRMSVSVYLLAVAIPRETREGDEIGGRTGYHKKPTDYNR